MSTDPFHEDGGGGFVAGLVARLRTSEAATTVTPPASARSHHRRTESEELDDHMAGSEYSPLEICPRCGYARMSSVYCSVSATHHGTDKPLNTPRREKKGLLQRIQDLIGTDDPKSDSDDGDTAVAADRTDELLGSEGIKSPRDDDSTPPPAPAPSMASPRQAATSTWSLFKSKEAKQLDDLRDEEERERSRLCDEGLRSLHIIDVNVKEYSKKVKGDQKAMKHERRDMEMQCKLAFDVIYKDRKEQVEVMQRIFTAELKKVKSEEKAAKKGKVPERSTTPPLAASSTGADASHAESGQATD